MDGFNQYQPYAPLGMFGVSLAAPEDFVRIRSVLKKSPLST